MHPAVGQLEALPYADATFDVTLVMGVLEYAEASIAVNEISRVTRPGGLVLITMLNPMSAYRIAEWFMYWPLLRMLDALEESLHVPVERRHGVAATGIHALTPGKLRRLMEQANLKPIELIYYDHALPIRSSGRLPSLAGRAGPAGHEREAAGRWSSWLGTGYLVTAIRG